MAPHTDIDLYTYVPTRQAPEYMNNQILTIWLAGTPNGHKVSITLEEIGVQYNVHKLEFSKNQQKEPWFLEINPNGRIPALVDKTSGKPKRVFEGASMQLYLAEKYDKENKVSFQYDSDEYWEMVEWLVWMQSGIGPMQGQANHFYRYAPEKLPYAINRYQTETKRLYTVLNDRLASERKAHSLPPSQAAYLVANKFSLADICVFSWVNWGEWAGVQPSEFPEIKTWLEAIEAREAVQKGMNVPDDFAKMKAIMKDEKKADEYSKKSSGWIMKGMKEEEEKL